MSDFEIQDIAFEGPKPPYLGYTIRASYLKEPHGADALIEVIKDGQVIRQFMFPAYKIYNLQAHFRDIVDGEIVNNTNGYKMAAWDGISGATFLLPKIDADASDPLKNQPEVLPPETTLPQQEESFL